MKKVLSIVLISIMSIGLMPLFAQQRECATMEVNNRIMAAHPEFRSAQATLEQQTADAVNSHLRTSTVVTIPVVFHILYSTNNSTQNISTARINDQLVALNEDFTATNADISIVPGAFQPFIGNANIQFCLAQRDPNGNATTGIIRKATTVTSWTTNDSIKFSSQNGDDAWPRDQYLNIWVGNLGGGLLGYAQFPGGPANTDGVVLLNGSVGGPNVMGTTSNYNLGRTATHEIGHWLNLRHIWGDSNCGNDFVADTPTQQTANTGCPAFPHVTCSNGPNGDMFMNYMDYVYDQCMVMFSAGQGTRMNSAITSSRSSLLTSLGCVPPVSAAPEASMLSTATQICKYQTVSFTDNSTNSPTSVEWIFPGGTPSSSTSSTPVVTYNSTGTYDVTLIVANAGGSDTLVNLNMVTVNGLPQVDVTAPGNEVIVCAGSALTLTANSVSPNLTYQWTRYGSAISGATNSTYDVTKTGNYKVLVTKPNGCSRLSSNYRVDKVPLPVVHITAGGPTTFCPGDSVVLTATQNATWNYVWKKYANIISGAATNQLTAYTSGSYKVIVTDQNGCVRSSNKISVNSVCRIGENQVSETMKIYPNPVQDILTFSTPALQSTEVTVSIYDALGKEVLSENVINDIADSEWVIDASGLHSGVYILVVRSGNEVLSSRFIRQ
ncbi:MAG TPA: M43 family zinc metalloprotease [Bacteroidia bacterium]|nr:M43 family zinc metalloprotease [Bacteroidia bacterium]